MRPDPGCAASPDRPDARPASGESAGRQPDDLERRRAAMQARFREGWVPLTVPAEQPRILSAAQHAWACRMLDSGGWSDKHAEVLRAVRDGAGPGERLPPPGSTPFIDGVAEDAEVIVTGTEPGRTLAILFSHQAYPSVRFGHRFARRDDKHSLIWLMEEIETGALHRMMRDAPPPAPDTAGITWTTFRA